MYHQNLAKELSLLFWMKSIGGESREVVHLKVIKESVRALLASPIVDKLPPSIWPTGFVRVNKFMMPQFINRQRKIKRPGWRIFEKDRLLG
jgi:hypothetical protein